MGFTDWISDSGGSLFSSALSFLGGERRNKAQKDVAQEQMQFQKNMSDTAYQRAVVDLKKAGINPMLISKMGGASTPPGAMPQMEDTVTPAVNTYMARRMNSAQVANIQADTRNKQATTSNIEADTALKSATAQQAGATVGQINANTNKIIAETKNIPYERERLKAVVYQLYEQAFLQSQQTLTEAERYEMVRKTVTKLKSETKLLDLDIKAAEALENLGRSSRELKPVIEIIRSILRR